MAEIEKPPFISPLQQAYKDIMGSKNPRLVTQEILDKLTLFKVAQAALERFGEHPTDQPEELRLWGNARRGAVELRTISPDEIGMVIYHGAIISDALYPDTPDWYLGYSHYPIFVEALQEAAKRTRAVRGARNAPLHPDVIILEEE